MLFLANDTPHHIRIGIFTAKGSHTVRLKFDAFAGQLVRERIWHPSQKIQELADGGLELTLQLSSLHEIEPWVLSWGEHVKILGPTEFKKRVATRMQLALEGVSGGTTRKKNW